ncbi:hypothetical protein QJQ45_001100 [Haematococcus lacustris]|nr:hypothetical protein QJQ45_001100 [Haematococcus lacustris]
MVPAARSPQPSPAQPSPAQPSPAQPSPAQPSPAQPSPAQPSPAQPSPAQPSPAQPSPAQPSPAQPSPAQPSPAQPSPAQPSPAQPSPAQPSPAQPSPAQPSPAQPSPAQPRCGVVWCGVVWCGVVWCGVVWCGVVWCGVAWRGVAWRGVAWRGVAWRGVAWRDKLAGAKERDRLAREAHKAELMQAKALRQEKLHAAAEVFRMERSWESTSKRARKDARAALRHEAKADGATCEHNIWKCRICFPHKTGKVPGLAQCVLGGACRHAELKMACGYGITAQSSELKAATLDKGHVADLIEEANKHRRLLASTG